MLRKLVAALLLTAIALTISISPAYAGADDQPVEWAGNPSSQRWSLTSIGQAWLVSGDECDWNDYVMLINKNVSIDSDRFRIYSFNGTVQSGFTGMSPIGHNLNTTSSYLCLGFTATWNGGGPLHVAANMFVWVQ